MRLLGYVSLALSCLSSLPIACSDVTDTSPAGTGGGSSAQATAGGHGSLGGGSAVGGEDSSGGEDGAGGDAATTTTARVIDVGGTSTKPATAECAQRQVPIEALPPDILIVMDRSTSMTANASGEFCQDGTTTGSGVGNCGDESKWAQTIVAIKAVVEGTQKTVNWGMFWLGNEPTQCGVGKAPVVPITSGDSYTPIQEALDGNDFSGQSGTPTAAAVKSAVNYLKSLTEPNPKYLLIATDGEPNCAGGGGGGGFGGGISTVDATGATDAVTAAVDAGFPTFVVGIATTDNSVASDALDAMAVAGGNPQEGAETKYYAVADTESLTDALNKIIGLATSCTISLENAPSGDWTIAIAAEDASGKLVKVENDETSGWVYTDEATRKSIELKGSACDNLKNGTYSNLQFVYTCPTEDVIL